MKNKHYFFKITIALSIVFCGFAIKVQANMLSDNIDSLLQKAYELRRSQPDSAILYAGKVLHHASNIPLKKALAYKRIGLANRYKGLYDEAISYYQKALDIEEEENDKVGQTASLNLIAHTYKKQGEYDKAVKKYLESLKVNETMPKTYRENLATDEVVFLDRELGDTNNNLGSVFSITGNFEKAETHFEKALYIRKKQKDTVRIASTHQDRGVLYFRMDSLNDALKEYTKSEELNRVINNRYALAQIYGNKGGICAMKEDYENAIENYEKSLLIKKELSNSRGVAVTTYNICELYYNEKKYKQAISYCDESIVYAQPLKDYRVLNSAEYVLYQIAKAQNKPTKALIHHEAYAAWKDSLDADEKDIQIQKIISEYEEGKKVAKLEEENRLQRIRYITTILFTLMAIGGLIFYSITKKKLHEAEKKRRIKEEELHKETEGRRIEGEKLHRQVIKNLAQDAEIQAANSEIDAKLEERTKVSSELHDSVCSGLVSAKLHLESVQDKIAEKDKVTFAKGLYLLDDAYNTCREISHELNPPMLEKFGLTHAIEDICEKLTTPQTDIQFGATQFDERLTQKQELTLYQSIQELIQNILKHSEATEAHVQLTDYEDSLNILVQDDGKGFDIGEMSEESGIGLQKIRTRMKHLGGSMEVDSSPGNGTTVIIDVPKTLSTHEINT